VFFRLAGRGVATDVWRAILSALDPADRGVAADRERLAAVRAARAAAAQAFFTRLAPEWDRLSTLHAPEAEVDAAILGLIGRKDFDAVLDLGTGTGRMLKLFAPSAGRAVGVDASHAMLAVARANLEAAGLRHVELRQGDIYAPPVERGAFDLVVIHQVLHYLDDPGRAIREAAAALAPSGLLLVVDFAPHDVESLRETHGHRRLGLAPDQVAGAMTAAGLDCVAQRDLPPPRADAGQLTVSVFLGRDRRIVTDAPFPPASLEVA
jgi:ArsR family transcriptional regulator